MRLPVITTATALGTLLLTLAPGQTVADDAFVSVGRYAADRIAPLIEAHHKRGGTAPLD